MKRYWPLLLLAVLTIAFFVPELTGGRGFLYADNLSQRIPTMTFWKQEVEHGRFPLWNPYILGGIPFFADLSNNVLAPTNLVYLMLPVPVSLTFLAVFYVAVAAIFTYFYLRDLTGKTIPSLFSAITFAFSGTVIAAVNDINSLQGIALIPMVVFTAHKYVKKPELHTSIVLAVALTLQFFSSHPQYSYYTWIIVALYLLILGKGRITDRILTTIGIFIVFLLLSAVQLLPFLELSKEVFRPETEAFTIQNQLSLVEIPRFVLANFYGSWKAGSSWGPGSQLETGLANTEGYMGIIPIVLAIYTMLKIKSKESRFWLIVALTALLLSLGNQTPLHEIARKLVPFFVKFRSPIRALCFYSFAIAVLAGLTINKFEKTNRQ